MATVEEVAASVGTLKTDLEALATTATTEFAKLEKEVKEGVAPTSLDALKASIDGLDTAVKGIVVPSA